MLASGRPSGGLGECERFAASDCLGDNVVDEGVH